MGIYDRDYYRNTGSRAGFGHFVALSVTTWLIVLNVAVFFLDAAIQPPPQMETINTIDDTGMPVQMQIPSMREEPGMLTRLGEFSIAKAVGKAQVWRFITYQFLHAYPWHLIMNMIGLYFFGPIIEGHFGSRRFLAFYLLCGAAGAVCFSALAFLHILHVGAYPLVGASGSIFGLLVASAIIAPDVQLFYYFIPVTIRTVAIISMGLAVYTVLHSGHADASNAGGEAAHFGGGLLGFLFIRNQHWLNAFEPSRSVSTRKRRRVSAFQKDWSKDMNR